MKNRKSIYTTSLLSAALTITGSNTFAQTQPNIQSIKAGDGCIKVIKSGAEGIVISLVSPFATDGKGNSLVLLSNACGIAIDPKVIVDPSKPKEGVVPPKPKLDRETAKKRLKDIADELAEKSTDPQQKKQIRDTQKQIEKQIDETPETELAETLTNTGVGASQNDQSMQAVMLLAVGGCFAAGGGSVCAALAPLFSGLFGEEVTQKEIEQAAKIGEKIMNGEPITEILRDIPLDDNHKWLKKAIEAIGKGEDYSGAIVGAAKSAGFINGTQADQIKVVIDLAHKDQLTCKRISQATGNVRVTLKPSVRKVLQENVAPKVDKTVMACLNNIFRN